MTGTPHDPRPAGRPLRVLIVDDDPDVCNTLGELVRLNGHEAQTARSAAEAVEQAQAAPPDIVLLDIVMPGGDGYAAARSLRRVLGRRPVLVAVTGWAHLEDRSMAERFDHHLVKPVDPELLAALLDRYADPPAAPE